MFWMRLGLDTTFLQDDADLKVEFSTLLLDARGREWNFSPAAAIPPFTLTWTFSSKFSSISGLKRTKKGLKMTKNWPVSGVDPCCSLALMVNEVGFAVKVDAHIPTFGKGARFQVQRVHAQVCLGPVETRVGSRTIWWTSLGHVVPINYFTSAFFCSFVHDLHTLIEDEFLNWKALCTALE